MSMRATYLSSTTALILLLLSATPLIAVVQGEAPVEIPEQRLTAEQAARFIDEIAPVVAELRGLEFKRPVPVQIVDEEGALAYMIKRIESFQTRQEIEDSARAYELLGLLPEGTDILELYLETMREEAGGFYDPASGKYYLLDDVTAAMGPMVAAHELTHALEDQHFSLDDRLTAVMDDDDQLFARSAVHEGSATLLMFAYMARAALNDEIDPDALAAYAESETAKANMLDELPDTLLRQLIAPYTLGASFLARGSMLAAIAKGYPVDDINQVYADEPLSSEQILHPLKYWNSEKRDEPLRLKFDEAGQALGPRWSKRLDGVLGEMTLGVMVGAPTPGLLDGLSIHIGAEWTNDAAMGWGGDRWELWVRGQSALVLLGTAWDSAADAEQFAAALDEDAGLVWKSAGDRVAIVAGDAGEKAALLLDLILAAR